MDRENVIKEFEHLLNAAKGNYMDFVDLTVDEGEEILALLKEQEAVEPRRIDGKRNHFIKCGNCNYDLLTAFQFCPHCGRSVKWE